MTFSSTFTGSVGASSLTFSSTAAGAAARLAGRDLAERVVRDLNLKQPKSQGRSEQWKAQMTLTQMIFSPKSDS